ncbi:hypothetical protein [Pedobacter sp. Leaf176]|uniref:hypothetical protein n=1 Tax=Pedobacter sp. Leaf176 TaxID=1736286 RepID=UPI000700D62D|nr:hypothetical protein [Pedobacter sp. Leaf176]KQR71146.1 hypothetical protein ASF92_07060 [Pedobacter sp. Leaf176]
MKAIIKAISWLCFTFFCNAIYAQKLKTESIIYSYNRLPSSSLKGARNYQVNIEAAYETKNKQLLDDYHTQKKMAQSKFDKEMAAYSGLQKDANERYAKAITEYNKKKLGTKILEKSLLESGKPQPEIIAKPYLENIDPPRLQSSYDYQTLADTYIQLDGFQKEKENAIKILILLYGFDNTVPRNVSEEDSRLVFANGSSSTKKIISYHNEFSYRHPMAVKVYDPAGKEILSLTPPELNSYKIYKSPSSDRYTTVNSELLIKTNEEKILQENFKFLSNLLNDRYGYSSVKRTVNLYYIKNADDNYKDLTTAFNEASSGLLLLQQDELSAGVKLNKACALWISALKEADFNNKKSRINKEIAMGIYFNLLEAYYATGNVREGQINLEKINVMSMANEDRRIKLDYDIRFAELKKRQSLN